jgi:dTDP-4-dehydrorhamnose reductase
MGDEPVVVVGQGVIGLAVGARLRSVDVSVIGVSRRPPPGDYGTRPTEVHWAINVATAEGQRSLADRVTDVGARSVVLVHGPSDVTWCHEHEQEATLTHAGAAEAVAATGAPTILVSTDNVFAGTRPRYGVDDGPAPANGYGRAKLAAERAVAAAPAGRVVRVSLAYGLDGDDHRPPGGSARVDYAELCFRTAVLGEKVFAPDDQVFSAVHIRDVGRALAWTAQTPDERARVVHVAGPEDITRADFARLAYRIAGEDPALVEGVPREETAWASRPAYSSLEPSDLSDERGRPLTPSDVAEGLMATWQARGGGRVPDLESAS